MDNANRLQEIEQEIRQVENEKPQREQMLGAFWEHIPTIDPIRIRSSYVRKEKAPAKTGRRPSLRKSGICRRRLSKLENLFFYR